MPIYSSKETTQIDAMRESLNLAEIGLTSPRLKGGSLPGDGCLGFPVGVLLLSIIDTLGEIEKYSRGRNRFRVLQTKPEFGALMSVRYLDIYRLYRCALVHSSTLEAGAEMVDGLETDPVLVDNNGLLSLNLRALFKILSDLVEKQATAWAPILASHPPVTTIQNSSGVNITYRGTRER